MTFAYRIRSFFVNRPPARIPRHAVPVERDPHLTIHPIVLLEKLKADPDIDPVHHQRIEADTDQIRKQIHQYYRIKHSELTHLYSSFDPDRLPHQVGSVNDASREVLEQDFFDGLQPVLQSANYIQLSEKEIDEAIRSASDWGVMLHVDFSRFRRVEIFARGLIVGRRVRYHFFRKIESDIVVYQRLVIIFQTKPNSDLETEFDPNMIHLRLFKNIPKDDIDMLIPGGGVRLTWFERGKIGIPTLWGFALFVTRLIRNATLLALLGIVKVFASFAMFVIVLVAVVYYTMVSVFRYSTARQKYLLNVAQNLYLQSLDTNAGVLLRLLEEAEQQDACECMLAHVLQRIRAERLDPNHSLDQRIERWLEQNLGRPVDFDAPSACRLLEDLGFSTSVADPNFVVFK